MTKSANKRQRYMNPGIFECAHARTPRYKGGDSIIPLILCCSGVEGARSLEQTQSPARLVEN